jgi:hypothetical protein
MATTRIDHKDGSVTVKYDEPIEIEIKGFPVKLMAVHFEPDELDKVDDWL